MKKWMRSSVGSGTRIALVVLCCGLASRAHAQAPTLPDVRAVCAPEVEHRRAPVEHEGDAGWWFHRDVATCMLGRLAALPLYADRVSLLERRAALSDERYEILSEALALGDTIQARYDTALDATTRRANAMAAELASPWRSPVLWAVVGAVVAGALVALSAYALDAAGGP